MNDIVKIATNSINKVMTKGTVIEKVALYDFMFTCLGTLDVTVEELKENKKEIKEWIKNEIGYYQTLNHVLSCSNKERDYLQSIYQELEEEQ